MEEQNQNQTLEFFNIMDQIEGSHNGSINRFTELANSAFSEAVRRVAQTGKKGKIVRGSESEYEFSVQVTPVIDEERGQLLFSLSMPGFDMVLDQIMEDEFADFNKLIGEQDNLLILRDY